MMLLLAHLNMLRMHRAIWHRHQHEKLMAKVQRYLQEAEGL